LDVKKRFTEEQIISFLREADAGLPIKELCRQHGLSRISATAIEKDLVIDRRKNFWAL
jgi:hypothetical protein